MTNKEALNEVPLYVKVPYDVNEYLKFIKEETGITKSDASTLIFELARKFISPAELAEIFDNYILLGLEGLTSKPFETENINRSP